MPPCLIVTVVSTASDHVRASILLRPSGHANSLWTLVGVEEKRGRDFLRLSNTHSGLYPRGSQEERHLDDMLLVVPH